MRIERIHTYEKRTFIKKSVDDLPTFKEETSVVDLRREEFLLQKIKNTAGKHENQKSKPLQYHTYCASP